MSIQESPEESVPATFICACVEYMRQACAGEGFYKEKEGKRYCVLHYPGDEKAVDFQAALHKKRSAKDYDFSGVWFPKGVSLKELNWDRGTNFSSASFNEHIDFSGVEFSARALFNDASFNAGVDFSGVNFSADANFSGVRFDDRANFNNAHFNFSADFRSASFFVLANFRSVRFDVASDFSSAKFDTYTDFESASFSQNSQ